MTVANIINIVGDVRDAQSGVILHGCNNQGVMGSGVALAIAEKWPDAKRVYLSMFRSRHIVHLGEVSYYRVDSGLFIANGITQSGYGHIGKFAKPEAISKCLKDVSHFISGKNIAHIVHMPKIGSDRGGLDFDSEVLPVIREVALDNPHITFVIYEYNNKEAKYV